MSGLVLAIIVAVVGLFASGLWFGHLRRREVETELGIQALANLKWRDCIAIVLEALHRDGYQRSAVAEAPAGGATEVMLIRDGVDVLLEYKHGTAYQITESNVREFVNDVSLNGAREGILVTLGSTEAGALRAASTHNVQVIGGKALWPKVRQYILPSLLESVRAQASARTRLGLWSGALASVAAGGVVYALMGGFHSGGSDAVVADADVAPLAVPSASGTASAPKDATTDSPMLAKMDANAKAFAEASKLSPEQLAQRRADVAHRISALPRVRNAAWSAQRTLLVSLRTKGDEAGDTQLLDEVCRLMVQQEEMRFDRVQLESPPESNQRVRWRSCE